MAKYICMKISQWYRGDFILERLAKMIALPWIKIKFVGSGGVFLQIMTNNSRETRHAWLNASHWFLRSKIMIHKLF
jgi:hypothetical protein